ncbi:MAG: esterase [Clostridia bacterium]|nr:esterase [Clostridia bacterium]
MAYFRIDYYSDALHRAASFEMLIPNDLRTDIPRPENPYAKRPMKTLFLLHGYTGKAGNWVPEWMAEKYNFAIVMPNGENGFYLDGRSTGHAYQTLVGVELVDYVRKTFGLAKTPEETFIAGLSMGGFGAIHTGLAYPETFGKVGALSSALIVRGIAGMQPGTDNGTANEAYYRECFGDLDTVLERDANPEVLAAKLQDAGTRIPELYMCCGTEDFLLEPNREFHRFLEARGIPHEYHEGPGVHDMAFWSEHIVHVVDWMFRDEELEEKKE